MKQSVPHTCSLNCIHTHLNKYAITCLTRRSQISKEHCYISYSEPPILSLLSQFSANSIYFAMRVILRYHMILFAILSLLIAITSKWRNKLLITIRQMYKRRRNNETSISSIHSLQLDSVSMFTALTNTLYKRFYPSLSKSSSYQIRSCVLLMKSFVTDKISRLNQYICPIVSFIIPAV